MEKNIETDDQHAKMSSEICNAYDIIASQHEGIVGGPFNTEYERPATLELLGDVSGKRILDAGCGPGSYAQLLIRHKAPLLTLDKKLKASALDINVETMEV